ncbi:RAD52 motif-containing protein 1-like [Delphinapterus leucas]|uniref:RAD52 motif-containing protein 1-like n=1 Tax=Delphinapterus leucas TaxID=9749 RepID=A0A2Y9MKF1_DELLE|nr:RAD52 motif-containing protein 1-like [Delphinapterus leucas]
MPDRRHMLRVIIIPYVKEGNPEACSSESYDRCIQKLLIVVLESGKTGVAYRPCEEVTDGRTEEELQDLFQVSYFSS